METSLPALEQAVPTAADTLHIGSHLHSGEDAKAWVESHLAASRACLAELLAVTGERNVANTLVPYDRACWHLRMAGSQSGVMFMVHPTASVRDAAQELSQVIGAEGVALSLNREVYQALAALDASGEDAATQYYLERTLLSYRLSGVDRDEATRDRIRSLSDKLTELSKKYNVPSEMLILEVTETEAMRDVTRTMDVLLRMRLRNIGVSIDDFGTGHSSLRELQRMPFSEMKIDKSFVLDMANNKDCAVIVNSIIDLSHNLGLRVIAEGVEDRRIWRMLNDKGCDYAQGFFMGKPMPAHEFDLWLKNWRAKVSN